MKKANLTTLYPKAVKIAWGLLFLTLPVTSFPYFPSGVGGKTLVRPLALYPLALLVFLLTIPRLLKRPLPKTFLPIFAFMVVALVSSVAAFSTDPEALRGVTISSRFLRNIITLGVGLTFYITIALLPERWEDLNYSLRWLYIGFAIALLWGTVQAVYVIHYSPTYFNWIDRIQSLISTRKLFTTRISGMTYEPKWFAEQICFLLLPWLIGSVIYKRSIFQWRFRWISVEWLLLIWSAIVLVFTFSRTGFVLLGVLIVLGFLLFRFRGHKRAAKRQKSTGTRRSRVLEIVTFTLTVVVVFGLIGSQNPYFSRLWRYWSKNRERSYLEYIAFEQRFVYLTTAYRIFEAYPILGVGLGNYAFYFDENLPDQPWDLQKEIVRQITPMEGRDRLITPKNLYARLLAETGLLGTAAFTTFLIAILGCLLFLWFSPTPDFKFWGLSGILAMVIFAMIIVSFDSFALPNMWVVFGLITAAAHIPEFQAHPAETTGD